MMKLKLAILGAFIFVAEDWCQPAHALTPRRSAEQLAADEVLYAAAAKLITPKVMLCFTASTASAFQPFKIRFFLADVGKRPQQFEIVEGDQVARPAKSKLEREAVGAIARCAPYSIPAELQNWGGFWVTVEFGITAL